MPSRSPVDSAAAALGDLLRTASAHPNSPQPDEVLSAVRDFERIEFETPDDPEADGFLFEYGIFAHSGPSAFMVSLTRQLEKVDESGDHESYTQVGCELSYDVNEALGALGRKNVWWFRGTPQPFDSWLAEVERDPAWNAIRGMSPISVRVVQDVI